MDGRSAAGAAGAGRAFSSTSATKRSEAKKPSMPPDRIRRTPTTRAVGPNFSRAAAIASSRVAASTDCDGTAHHSQGLDLCRAGHLAVGDDREAGQDLADQAGQGGSHPPWADEDRGPGS